MECIGMDTTSVVVKEYDQKVSSGASFGEGLHLWLHHGHKQFMAHNVVDHSLWGATTSTKETIFVFGEKLIEWMQGIGVTLVLSARCFVFKCLWWII